MKKGALNNLAWVTVAGYYSIFVSLIKNFVLAYILSTIDYANVQTYVLYQGYSWLFLLGFTDGIYLKYGKYDVKDVPLERFRAFTRLMVIAQLIVLILIVAIGWNTEKRFITINIALGIFLNNMSAYFSTVNKFTCRFKQDAIGTIMWNTSFLLILVMVIVSGRAGSVPIIVGQNIANAVYLLYLALHNRLIIVGESATLISVLSEAWHAIKTGFFVMLSVTVGQVVMSIDKMFVNILFDTKSFALYSFAVSVIALLFNTINSSSKVVFPYLSRIQRDKSKDYYLLLSDLLAIISVLLCTLFFVFVPIISLVIPKYIGAAEYIGILFPCLMFKVVFNVLSDNFYKYLGRIREYALNGVIALIVAITLNAVSYFCFGTVKAIAYASVLTFAIWYVINEVFFVNWYKVRATACARKYLLIIISLVSFYFLNGIAPLNGAICYLLIIVVAIVLLYRSRLKQLVTRIITNR